MTAQQLLSWVAYAHDRHDCSYDDVLGKHRICLKQSLLESEPKMESHGYGTSEGERDLAIVLIHTCNYDEVCAMENQAYNIASQPMNIPLGVRNGTENLSEQAHPDPEPEPFYISAEEAIRQAEARHTPRIYYDPIPGMPPVHPAPAPAPFMESPLRALSVEESRNVFSRALNSYRDSDEVVLNQQLATSMTEIQELVTESMQNNLNEIVTEGCTIPMDLRISSI